jgi:hypothetical protein
MDILPVSVEGFIGKCDEAEFRTVALIILMFKKA